MAFFNIFKKKKKEVKAEKIEKIKKTEKVEKPEKVQKEPETVISRPKKISGQAYRILKRPHVTEKATDLTSKNQYIFEVFQNSNKNQVKKAVEDVYGVDVVGVRIINIARKKRRLGKIEGWRQGYKKAIVKVKKGQKIEVLPR